MLSITKKSIFGQEKPAFVKSDMEPKLEMGIKKAQLFLAPPSKRDLCKTPPFARFPRQTQILILEILNVFLRLKFSSSPDDGTCSLNLNEIEHFSKVSAMSRLKSIS
jgi:hypothetical protein